MSPAWARRGGWAIYLYASEPHRVPHVAVRGPGYRANIRIADGEVLAGNLPPQVLREVRELLAAHQALAVKAFQQTSAHAFPGTLEEMLDVIAVRVLARYVVELTFDDGAVKVLDLEGWLTGPDFAWLRDDYDAFCAVTVDAGSGTIRFPNGAEFSPSGLYLAAKPVVPA